MDTFFWIVYSISALAAFYHSFRVFSLSDPWYVALLSAVAIDGITFYAMAILGKWTGKQRITGFIGVVLFATISGLAQIIWRYEAQGIVLPEFLRVVSLALVPLSTTGAVVALGLMHYFGVKVESKPVQASFQKGISTVVEKESVPQLEVKPVWPEPIHSNGNGVEKRKPGRPKTVYAKDVDPNSLKP